MSKSVKIELLEFDPVSIYCIFSKHKGRSLLQFPTPFCANFLLATSVALDFQTTQNTLQKIWSEMLWFLQQLYCFNSPHKCCLFTPPSPNVCAQFVRLYTYLLLFVHKFFHFLNNFFHFSNFKNVFAKQFF